MATPATSHRYTFFNANLIDSSYAIGDIYSPEKIAQSRAEWEFHADEKSYPYLKHIKDLSARWPHLRLLADFMEVGTTPARWTDMKKAGGADDERKERASRTNVTRLDYLKSLEVIPHNYKTPKALRSGLDEKVDNCQLKLFVVEDLSRDVIELLGASLDIEPAFFREHIVDYAWYNTRDQWVDPPNLNVIAKQQRWIQIRFVTARYFKTSASFEKGRKMADLFNVLRRPDDDINNKAMMDDKNAIVGLTRTRASFWLQKADPSKQKEAVGVLLLDPTIQEGIPLWYGYRNWEVTPGIKDEIGSIHPPRDSLFNDLIYWAQKPEAFTSLSSTSPTSNSHLPIQALLHLICAEWLTMAEYVKTRLGQIEWEVSFPEHFLHKGSQIDVSLKKLHHWRRLVPLYREMLSETLQRVFHFPCHTGGMGSMTASANHDTDPAAPCSHATPQAAQPLKQGDNDDMDSMVTSRTGDSSGNSASNGTDPSTPCRPTVPHVVQPVKQGPIDAFRDDFTRALFYMEEYQQRIDRLTSVVTAIITIDDSRRSQDDNRNVARLTWLATFFIPLSFMASLFSMQERVDKLTDTFKLYFEISVPLAAISLGLVFTLALPSVRRFGRRLKRSLSSGS